MYCSNCGKEVNDQAVICVHCGVPIKGRYEEVIQQSTQPVQEQKPVVKNVCSLIGFIFSMIGLLFGILLPLPAVGLVLSSIGFCQSKAKKEADSLGLAGLIVSSILLAFWIIIWIVLIITP